jgi:predicted membrane-bound dolichyl-phosphate-mannose-protein mannosyltransferase
MKSNATRIFGYIAFILTVLGLVFWTFFFFDELVHYRKYRSEILLIFSSVYVLGYSTLHYLVSTKFWTLDRSDLEKLDYEIEILKKKIEQKELKSKL